MWLDTWISYSYNSQTFLCTLTNMYNQPWNILVTLYIFLRYISFFYLYNHPSWRSYVIHFFDVISCQMSSLCPYTKDLWKAVSIHFSNPPHQKTTLIRSIALTKKNTFEVSNSIFLAVSFLPMLHLNAPSFANTAAFTIDCCTKQSKSFNIF